MSKKDNKEVEVKVKVEVEPFYSDIIEVEFIDENGETRKKRTFMNHDKFVKEEISGI